jgi:hypothetical protein
MESRMRRKAHVRFGGRARETDQSKDRHRALVRPNYYALEHRFEVWLCNAHHVKNVPGRKTDMSDAEWLADVVAHGMVRASFVPPPPIRELRDLTRYRKRQIDTKTAEVQRLEKVLQDAGIKLSSVASEVLSKSGRRMLEALIAGQRDPAVLAEMALGKMRIKRPALGEALAGQFGPHHAVAVRQILDHVDFLDTSVAVLSEQVATRIAPFAAAMRLLTDIPRDQPAVGRGDHRRDRCRHEPLPQPRPPRLVGRSVPGQPRIGRQASPRRHHQRQPLAAANTDRVGVGRARTKGSYFGAQYRQIAHRRGPNKAAVAVAHSLLDVIWHILTTGELFTDLGADYYQRHRDPERITRRLVHQLEQLGHTVTITPAA